MNHPTHPLRNVWLGGLAGLACILCPAIAGADIQGSYLIGDDSNATVVENDPGRHGYQIASGDLDGDGQADLVASSPLGGGAVYVTLGPISDGDQRETASADIVFEGDPGVEAGWSLAVGDVIGDYHDDLIIGAPSAASGKGRIYVFEGPMWLSTVISADDATATYEGINSGGYAAWSLAVGDTDGDGKDELAVGACGTSGPGRTGDAFLVHGVTAGTHSLAVPGTTHFLGRGLTGCSMTMTDFDGDGLDDLAIGSHGTNQHGVGYGGDVHLFYGRPIWASSYDLLLDPDSMDAAVVYGLPEGGNFGYALGAEDVNRDGYGDLLIGQPEVRCDGCVFFPRNGGYAYVLLGGPSSASGRPLVGVSPGEDVAYLRWQGEDVNDQAGISLAGVGDVHRPWGGNEYVIGTGVGKAYVYGMVYAVKVPTPLYRCTIDDVLHCEGPFWEPSDTLPTQIHGSLANATARFEDPRPNTAAGRIVAGVGDLDGGGTTDIAIGAPHQLQFDSQNSGPGEVHLFFAE